MSWPINYQPPGPNHAPVLIGYDSTSTAPGGNTVPVAVDKTNGSVLVQLVSGGTTIENVNLNEVGGAAFALGQTVATGSLPVVINSDTLLATSANQTNGTQQSKITDGTSILTVPTQGSTTAGQNGLLLMGAVLTAAPSYSTTQTSPLSLTTAGYLRVQARSDSTTGTAVPTTAYFIGISDGTNLVAARTGLVDATSSALINGTSFLFNGTNFDRTRGYAGVSAGTATGIQATATVGGLMPIGTKLNTSSNHLTSNATTTLTAATAYISSIAISNEIGGTTSTITIQDKSGTPLKLVNGLATTAITTAPTIISFNTPVLMTSGIDVITAGAVAATVDVWVNYYQ